MSDSKCPSCGADRTPVKVRRAKNGYTYTVTGYACGKSHSWGPATPETFRACPNAERLLAESRDTIARMTSVIQAAEAWYDSGCTTIQRLARAVKAYRGTR